MNEEVRNRIATTVKRRRQRSFASVDAARIAAGVSRGTWENVEAGRPVREANLLKVWTALDLPDSDLDELLAGGEVGSEGTVGGAPQDADYVSSPGPRVEPGLSDADVLAEVRAMRERLEALERALTKDP